MRRSPLALVALQVVALWSSLAATSSARAAGPADGAATSPGGSEVVTSTSRPAPRVLGLEGTLAVRANRIRSAGFDAFSSGDELVESALGASYWFARTPAFGAAAGFEWSHGAASSRARDTASSLDVDGLALALKASFSLFERWAVFVRLAPGLLHLDARLQEASAPPAPGGDRGTSPLSQTKWLPALDAAAGTAFRVASTSKRPGGLVFGYWLTAEGGYGYSPRYAPTLGGAATLAGSARADQAVRLGDLSLRGSFVRFGFAMTL